MSQRTATYRRETAETQVSVTIGLDGTGKCKVETGNGVLDHLLAQLPRHGLVDLEASARGDVKTGWHHTVEDVAIALGRALDRALGERRGIVRIAHAYAPLDEALGFVVVDLSGRGYAVVDVAFAEPKVGGLDSDMIRHFIETLANEGRMNVHASVVAGQNGHHKAEALFKALARALDAASRVDERLGGAVPSTKGTLA